MSIKVARRAESRELRNRFHSEATNRASLQGIHESIAKNVVSLLPKSGLWASYRAMGSEVDPSLISEKAKGIEWVFPRVEGDRLGFYRPVGSEFEKNGWGVWEPVAREANRVDQRRIDGFIVPGLAFDPHGGRLGQGKGYYDKTLNGLTAVKIGVAFSVQMIESVPVEEHDVRMDFVVTEKSVFSAGANKYVEGKVI